MAKKIIRRKIQASHELNELPSVLQRIFAARHVRCLDDLNRELSALLPFNGLLDIEKAYERLYRAMTAGEKILVIGDFDADGATSTALAVSALKKLGAKQVEYIVPNRFTYGYGLTPEIVEVASKQNPKVIITVDNGIASHAGVDEANRLGMDVIITDHHLAAETLPAAYAIVNPNQPNDTFPSKCLAGVGVIFYVMVALRSFLKEKNWFAEQTISMPNMAEFLDLVALGTVADVVPLDKNNRILVYQGLQRIRSGKTRPGILSLLAVAKRNYQEITSSDLGFVMGPRLNAAGRLDDMSFGIACLLAENFEQANEKAQLLNQLNQERRAIESQMNREAFEIVDQLNLNQQLPLGVCLYHEKWHQGVVGLVASRVKEKIYRPVIAFAKIDENTLKGSARSVPGIHIRDVLNGIATKHPEILSKFGGHAMAAGLTISLNDFEAFKTLFAEEIGKFIDEESLYYHIETDGDLHQDEFTLQMAELIESSGPWGQEFPEPLFDGEFQIMDQRIVGQRHLKLLLQPKESGIFLDAIAFNINLDEWPNPRREKIHLAYRLNINEFNQRKKLQLIVEEIL